MAAFKRSLSRLRERFWAWFASGTISFRGGFIEKTDSCHFLFVVSRLAWTIIVDATLAIIMKKAHLERDKNFGL